MTNFHLLAPHHTRLREQGIEVWLTRTLVPLLLYADDIVLVADSINALNTSLVSLTRNVLAILEVIEIL